MQNNKLILYKENIFAKISNFFKNLFWCNKKDGTETINEVTSYNNQCKENFIENIVIKENEEEKRLKALQLQYDNGEIDEQDISEDDMDKLIEMYEKETEELNADTERRKNHIAQMLKELKST